LRPNRATLLDVLPDHLGLNGTKITGLQISFLGSGHNLFRKRSKEKNRRMNRKWHELDRQSDTELFLLADVEGLASGAECMHSLFSCSAMANCDWGTTLWRFAHQ